MTSPVIVWSPKFRPKHSVTTMTVSSRNPRSSASSVVHHHGSNLLTKHPHRTTVMSLTMETPHFMLPRELHPNYSRILKAIRESSRPLSGYDLELRCFLDVRNVRVYLKLMHSQRKVHIRDWRRDAPRGPWVPLYCYGANDNEPSKPHVLTLAERRKRWRQNEGVKEKEAARKRSKRRMKSVESVSSVVSFMLGIK